MIVFLLFGLSLSAAAAAAGAASAKPALCVQRPLGAHAKAYHRTPVLRMQMCAKGDGLRKEINIKQVPLV